MPAEHERQDGGWSRRQLLARSAVAAGVVWAAPVIRSTAAYATSAAGTERPCTQFFWCWIDLLGTREVRLEAIEGHPLPAGTTTPTIAKPRPSDAEPQHKHPLPGIVSTTTSTTRPIVDKPPPPIPQTIGPDPLPPGIVIWRAENPDVPLAFPTLPPMLTQTSDQAWAVLLPAVTGANASARQCRLVRGIAHAGKDFLEGFVDPLPPIKEERGRRLLFPTPGFGEPDNKGAVIDHLVLIYCCP